MKVVNNYSAPSSPTAPHTPSPQVQSLSLLAIIVAGYLFLNILLNLSIKWSLGHFGLAFPLTLTTCHLAATFIFLAPAALSIPIKEHRATLHKQWKGLVIVSACMALNIGLNNASLTGINLSLNQVIRSSVPVVTALIAIPVEGVIPTRIEAISIACLTTGVMMAVWEGSATGSPLALMACLGSTLCGGAMVSFSGKVLSEKLDVVRYATYTSPIACAVLMPMALLLEWDRFWKFTSGKEEIVFMIIAGTSVIAVGHLLMNSLLIKHAGAVASTVVGNVKVAALIVLSTMLLGEGKHFTPNMAFGCALAIGGFIMYTNAHLKTMKQKRMNVLTSSASTVGLVRQGESEEMKSLLLNGGGGGKQKQKIPSRTGSYHELMHLESTTAAKVGSNEVVLSGGFSGGSDTILPPSPFSSGYSDDSGGVGGKHQHAG